MLTGSARVTSADFKAALVANQQQTAFGGYRWIRIDRHVCRSKSKTPQTLLGTAWGQAACFGSRWRYKR